MRSGCHGHCEPWRAGDGTRTIAGFLPNTTLSSMPPTDPIQTSSEVTPLKTGKFLRQRFVFLSAPISTTTGKDTFWQPALG